MKRAERERCGVAGMRRRKEHAVDRSEAAAMASSVRVYLYRIRRKC